MSDWSLLFATALVYGLGLSFVLTIVITISGALALDMWVGDYPPDIKHKYGPMSARAARLRPWIAALVFGAFLIIPMLGLFSLRAAIDQVSLIPAWVFAVITLLVFNTFDLLILDWLFFCTIQPRAMILPGTEGMAGYRDYRFHLVGFGKGLAFCAVGSLVIVGLWMAAQGFGL